MKRVVGFAAIFMVFLELASPKLVGATVSEGGHEHFRIVGVITKLSSTEMDVKNKEGKTYTVDINKKTVVKRGTDKTELDLSVLKVGQTVVVDAYGDDEFDLEALDIRIVPPIGSPSLARVERASAFAQASADRRSFSGGWPARQAEFR
jgi:hypothetical protein